MVVRKITVGARQFSVSGITLGTSRRQPHALNTATKVLRAFARDDDASADMASLAPTPAEVDDIVALIVDGIQAAGVDTADTETVNALLNDLSVAQGTVQLFSALGAMFKDDAKVSAEEAAKADTSGNSEGSKSPI